MFLPSASQQRKATTRAQADTSHIDRHKHADVSTRCWNDKPLVSVMWIRLFCIFDKNCDILQSDSRARRQCRRWQSPVFDISIVHLRSVGWVCYVFFAFQFCILDYGVCVCVCEYGKTPNMNAFASGVSWRSRLLCSVRFVTVVSWWLHPMQDAVGKSSGCGCGIRIHHERFTYGWLGKSWLSFIFHFYPHCFREDAFFPHSNIPRKLQMSRWRINNG